MAGRYFHWVMLNVPIALCSGLNGLAPSPVTRGLGGPAKPSPGPAQDQPS